MRAALILSLMAPILPHVVRAGDQPPLIIGHRGLFKHAPENTLPCFAACIDLGFGFELDIRRTQDGHLVCLHDDNVKRTTNGAGKVAELLLDDVRKLDAGGWFDPAFAGAKVPLLDEVFALLKERKRPQLRVALDFKIDDDKVHGDVVRLAEKHGVLNQVICIGLAISAPSVRQKLRAASPRVAVAVLAARTDDLPDALKDANADWIYLRFIPTPEQVSRIHRAGKRVFLSGPLISGIEPANWESARAAAVDVLLSDYPLECRQAWRAKK